MFENGRLGQSKEAWFRQFLYLKNGFPLHDTFNRVFSCLFSIIQTLVSGARKRTTIASHGKTLRGPFDQAKGQSALHLVFVFAWRRTSSRSGHNAAVIQRYHGHAKMARFPRPFGNHPNHGCDGVGAKPRFAKRTKAAYDPAYLLRL